MENPINKKWTPQPGPQVAFSQAWEYEVCKGGAKGGGKSDSLLYEGLRQIENPHYHAAMFRRTFPRLQELMDRAVEPFRGLGGVWKEKRSRWEFPSGAKYSFFHMQHENSKFDHQGKQYSYLAFDQLEEFTETQYLYLMAQNRTSHDSVRCYVRSSANPGNIGHAWVKERFIDACPPVSCGEKAWKEEAKFWYQPKRHGPTFYDPETKMSRNFIPSFVFDNKILLKADPQYLQRLLNLPPDDRRALLEGDWDIYAGQFFSMFRKDIHGIEPFEIPHNWKVWGAIDYGEATPTSFGLYVKDGINDSIYRIAEYYSPGFATEHAMAIYSLIERCQWVNRRPQRVTIKAPGDMWIKRRLKGGETPKSAADYFDDCGLVLKKIDDSDRSRVHGWSTCKQFLNWQHDNGEVILNPQFRYFIGECPEFEKYLPAQVYDDIKKEDLKKGATDHSADELRYGLTGEDKEKFEISKRLSVRGA